MAKILRRRKRRAGARRISAPKLSRPDRVALYRKMRSYLRSNLELRHAIDIMISTARQVGGAKRREQAALVAWRALLQEGFAIRDLIGAIGGGPSEIALVSAAEETKQISRGFQDCVRLLSQGRDRQKVLVSLGLPIIQFLSGPIIFFGAAYAFVPAFEQIFPTEHWKGVPQWLVGVRPYVLPGMVGFLGAAFLIALAHWRLVLYGKGSWRRWCEVWHPPFIIYRLITAVTLLKAFSRLIAGGLRDTVALETLIATLPARSHLHTRLRTIHGHMTNGLSFGVAALRAGGDWPDRRFIADIIAFSSSSRDFGEGGGLEEVIEIWEEDVLGRLGGLARGIRLAAALVFYGALIAFLLVFADLQGQSVEHARSLTY